MRKNQALVDHYAKYFDLTIPWDDVDIQFGPVTAILKNDTTRAIILEGTGQLVRILPGDTVTLEMELDVTEVT